MVIDLNDIKKSGIFYKEQVIDVPSTSFIYTHMRIANHQDMQVCLLLNVADGKQRMFYRKRFSDGSYSIFREVINSREVL